MAKNKSDSPRSWRRKPAGKSPRQQRTGVGADQMDGPYRSFDGRWTYIPLEGSPTFEMPDRIEDTATWVPGGGETPGTDPRGKRKHLPRKKGKPGPM